MSNSKLLAAIILSPLAAGAAFAAGVFTLSALSNLGITFPLISGAAVYCAVYFRRMRAAPRMRGRGGALNRYSYVLAHELSHALAALLSGAGVRKVAVGRTGGYVSLNATNAFISLAPYFIPFYAVVAGLLYGLAGLFLDTAPYRPLFAAATGFFLAFHLLNTLDILAGPLQSDLKKAGGAFFSFPLVALLNSLCLVLMLKLVFPGLISLKAYAARAWNDTAMILRWMFAAVSYLYNTAKIEVIGL